MCPLYEERLIFKPSWQQTPSKTHECFPRDGTSWSDYMNNLLFVCLFSIKAAYFHTTFLECLITAPNTCMESGRPPPSRLSLRVWPGFDFTIRERSGSPCWLFMFCYGIIQCCSIEITGSVGNFSVIWGIACASLVIMVTLSCPARDLHGNDQWPQALVWRDKLCWHISVRQVSWPPISGYLKLYATRLHKTNNICLKFTLSLRGNGVRTCRDPCDALAHTHTKTEVHKWVQEKVSRTLNTHCTIN